MCWGAFVACNLQFVCSLIIATIWRPMCRFGKSLNKEYRKRELMKITEENLQILRRIQHKEP